MRDCHLENHARGFTILLIFFFKVKTNRTNFDKKNKKINNRSI